MYHHCMMGWAGLGRICPTALACAALRCAVLCCAVLCCAVLCCAVLCCAVLDLVMFSQARAVLSCAVLWCHNAMRDRPGHVVMSAKTASYYLASLALCIADGLTKKFVVMQGQAETGSSRQEPGLQHEATTAAVQAHTAAAEMQARGAAGEMVGPLGGEGWQGPSDEDPVSPTGSSGSALDPQLYRWAFAGGSSLC